MTTYPYGYSGSPQGMGSMLTFEQLAAKATVAKLDPEFRRRVFALMAAAAAAGVPLGVGTGWRIQPKNKPGFAAPGNSNHEGFPADGTSGGAVAADMVPNVSWPWMEANVARFGLRTFRNVNSEPWHIQPAEIPTSRNRRTTPWKLAPIALPDDVAPPTPPPPVTPPPVVAPPPPVTPPNTTRYNVNANVQDLKPTDTPEIYNREVVKICQGIVNTRSRSPQDYLVGDGIYGIHTIAAVMDFQRATGLDPDGWVGPQTWAKLLNG